MLLVYIDESGINYETIDGFWTDGPYAIWSSILVPENKYFHVERMYYELIRKLLGIKDWRTKELHATNIWARKDCFSTLPETKIARYFEELFQLLCKLSLHVVVAVQQKNPRRRSKNEKKEEIKRSIYSFLHNLEYRLSSLGETGVLIADFPGAKSKDSPHDSDIQELLFNRSKWRYDPGARGASSFRSKFDFETRACFLLDQIHHSDSKTSFFLQLADHVSFVIQRVLTHLYLEKFPASNRPKPDSTMVPVTSSTFNFFVGQSNLSIGFFDKGRKDVTFLPTQELLSNSRIGSNTKYINPNVITEFTPYK